MCTSRAIVGLLAVSAALCASGCGNSSAGESVHGQVSYRGQPLTNGNVSFFPATGRAITVLFASDGQYDAELPPGNYSVVIGLGAELPPDYKEGDPLPPPRLTLPDQYSTRAKSTLTATVSPDHQEPINFDLK